MGILVYRDSLQGSVHVGRIDYEIERYSSFRYDDRYIAESQIHGNLGISEQLPISTEPYGSEEIRPYFQGLLPEGESREVLARMYQVPRNDYLTLLERLGCESIGALTFVSEKVDTNAYCPKYSGLSDALIASLRDTPAQTAARIMGETRLSLSGAQNKVAWCLPESVALKEACLSDWLVPEGTAPSTHIIKISRRGEEDLALNELACSLIAKVCDIETVDIDLIPDIPGAIAVKRYDRVWVGETGERRILRLHQEDLCQAMGFAPYLKYQPEGLDIPQSYVSMIGDVLEDAAETPLFAKQEFARRILFSFVIGNSDFHLKNTSLLYDIGWASRTLAPLYDIVCIPLAGYSTKMAFSIGNHRKLEEITDRDLIAIPIDLDIDLDTFGGIARALVTSFESFDGIGLPKELSVMVARIMNDAKQRLDTVKRFLDG